MPRASAITSLRCGAWPRRLVYLFLMLFAAAVAFRVFGVYRQRAAHSALEKTGWTVVYSDPGAAATPSFVQQLIARVDSTGRISGFFGAPEPEPVSISIIELEEGLGQQDLDLLTRLPALESLSVHRRRLSDDDLALIASLTTLKELSLTAENLDDAGIVRLAALTGLERLALAGERVTDDGIAPLAALPRLAELDVQSTRVSGTGLQDFSGTGTLRRLSMGPYTVDEGLIAVGTLRGLQELTIAGRAITDDGVAALSGLGELQVLVIADYPQITDAGLASIARLISLKTCALESHRITFHGASQFGALPALTDLELSGVQLNDAGLARFTPPASLQVLRLDHTSVTEAAFDAFERAHPNLKLWR